MDKYCFVENVSETFGDLTARSDGGCEYGHKTFREFCFAQEIRGISEKWVLLISCSRILTMSFVGKLMKTWLGVSSDKFNCSYRFG